MKRRMLFPLLICLFVLVVELTCGTYIKSIVFAGGASRVADLRFGNYEFGMCIDKDESILELSSKAYSVIRMLFENQKLYKAPGINFLGYNWDLQIGAVNGIIYKLNPIIQTSNKDKANDVVIRTLEFCKSKFGTPKQLKTGQFIWDTSDGSVILQTVENKEGFKIFLVVTSFSVENKYKKPN